MINTYIAALAAYGLKTGLITADDRIFAINSILAALGLDDYEEPENIPAGLCLLEEYQSRQHRLP